MTQPRLSPHARLASTVLTAAFVAAQVLLPPAATATPAPIGKTAAGQKLPATWTLPNTMPMTGGAQPLVTIIEVSDFQCPFCTRVQSTLRQVLAKYPGDVRLIWANNPLAFHSRAMPAALAALAAHRQGLFWQMHDKLFANQRALTDDNLRLWAIEIGLDLAQFDADIRDPQLAEQIKREQRAAIALGARGTPGFFINGKLLVGAQPIAAFERAIDDALVTARRARATGATGTALLDATFKAHAPSVGPKVLAYFFKGANIVTLPRPHRAGLVAKRVPDNTVWRVPVDPRSDAILGNSALASVTVVMFSDFECPFCRRGSETIRQVSRLYGDKVRMVFKHFPLPFHRNALEAHRAAIAAGKQGTFWPFHDKLFAGSRSLDEAHFAKWASECKLNRQRFDRDRKAATTTRHIAADQALARSLGVRGAPTFFINGRKLTGAQPLAKFQAAIDAELKRAAGRKGPAYYARLQAKASTGTGAGAAAPGKRP